MDIRHLVLRKKGQCLETSGSDEEIHLVLSNINDIIIEHLIKESIYSANEVAAEMQIKHQVKKFNLLMNLNLSSKGGSWVEIARAEFVILIVQWQEHNA